MTILDKLFGTEDDTNNQNKQNSNNQGATNSATPGQDSKEGTLELRKEELDINKNKVQSGEVTLSKKVVEEQQSVDVPVTHEEVVIERRALNNQPTDSQIGSSSSTSSSGSDSDSNSIANSGFSSSTGSKNSGSTCPSSSDNNNSEAIRIPLTEEQVQVDKRTVVTGEVTAYKRDVEQTQKVQDTVRREEALVNKSGNAAIATDSDYTSNSQTSSTSTNTGGNSNDSDFE